MFWGCIPAAAPAVSWGTKSTVSVESFEGSTLTILASVGACAVVLGGLLYSSVKVYRWARVLTGGKGTALGLVTFLEAGLLFSGVQAVEYFVLGALTLINLFSAAFKLHEDQAQAGAKRAEVQAAYDKQEAAKQKRRKARQDKASGVTQIKRPA